jgi:malate dehydrogenase (oxaloacetate-decarboxylating)
MDYSKEALKIHKKKRGKIGIVSKVPLKTRDDLSIAYTPGVGAVCQAIAADKEKSFELTNRANQVAIVSDGTAVLGFGDLGAEAAMPVMEGKSAIFKEFAGIDAMPLCINTTDTEAIINFCKAIEPSFAGINLEDIAAPRCFEILARLEKELSIPVFHDDQDGTAIVTLAALINALRVKRAKIESVKIVVNGAGAAGLAITRLLLAAGAKNISVLDSIGLISSKRKDLNKDKQEIAKKTNRKQLSGGLIEALQGADVFIGVSKGNVLTPAMVHAMSDKPIILAMANPVPEIMPSLAYAAGAIIVGTGRSDFPNQVNNALVFPGLFRGLLDARVRRVTLGMKLAAAKALASLVKPTAEQILPLITDKRVVKTIAKAVKDNS